MSDSDYSRMSLEALAKKANSKDNIVIVCGAGLSFGVAPLAGDVKGGLLAAVEELANQVSKADISIEKKEIVEDYFTLELFVSGLRHRVPSLEGPLRKLYEGIFRLKALNRSNKALATALGKFTSSGKRAVILTANFDDGLTGGLEEANVKYRLITRHNVHQVISEDDKGATVGTETAMGVDVCAYHGTVQATAPNDKKPSEPTSMTARNLAHPFPPSLSQYVHQSLANAGLVLFIGHRGEDFYDLNMELRRIVQLGAISKDRFLCVPHMGDPKEVAKSYENLFGKRGLALLQHLIDEDWIGDLFDAMSGDKTPSPEDLPKVVGLEDVKEDFLKLVESSSPAGSPERLVIQKQCAALLDDIRVGALAAWSVIEHYRLESLGYTQEEIAAFGRPKNSKYHELPIAELIQLQKDYQGFRDAFNKLLDDPRQTITPSNGIFEKGLELADKLENFASDARKALPVCTDGTQKAIGKLLAAIPYDYCGLVGMRLMNVIHAPPEPARIASSSASLETLLNDIDAASMRKLAANAKGGDNNGVGWRTELLFRVSAALAREAGDDLITESAKLYSDRQIQEAYAGILAQIVGWQDWELAPTENRLRLSFIDVGERLEGYETMIDKRIQRMKKEEEAEVSVSERSFSAAADAAQCAVRVCEVARLLASVSDFGLVVRAEELLRRPDAQRLLGKIPTMARKCIRVAKESSSVPNHLIMQAYDALLLESLLNGRGNSDQILSEAESYAKDAFGTASNSESGVGFQFARRMRGLKSRIPDAINITA